MKNGKYCNGKKSLNMKPLALLLALVLLVGCAVGGTIAWLTAQSGPVTNTFTVGDITIKLDEEHDDGFKIVPGATDTKDPLISVKEGSEPCYVYALVENNLVLGNDVVGTLNIDTNKWISVVVVGNKTLYRYYQVVTAAADNNDSVEDYTPLADHVFTTVYYDPYKITKENIGQLADKTVIIDAFAHQADHITDVSVADAAAKGHFGLA